MYHLTMKSVIKSISNMRDLSIVKSNNVKIKKGVLYRSANLSTLKEKDISKFNNLHIDTIYDLRFNYEALDKNDINTNSKYIAIPFFTIKNSLDKEYIEKNLKNATNDFYLEMVRSFETLYTSIFNNEALKLIFNSLNNHEKILFHCSGGKDRTGVTALLIELALGFSIDEAKADYLLTKKYRKKEKFLFKLYCLKNHINKYGNKVLNLFYVEPHEELFNLTINTLFNKYSSIEEFLYKKYNITKEMIKDWKDFYLEK